MSRVKAKIIEKVQNTHDVWTLKFLVNNKPLPAEAGQYITVFYDDTDIKEGKAYSLSSCPGDKYSSITVKRVGLFSGRITSAKPGDTLDISEAYGFFNAFIDGNLICLSSGVGLSPNWSVIRHELLNNSKRYIDLFYVNRTGDDIIFHDDIVELAKRHLNFRPHFFTTRQKCNGAINRRPAISTDVAALINNDARVLMCGATDFTRDMWHQLTEAGMDENNISTEVFFGRNEGD